MTRTAAPEPRDGPELSVVVVSHRSERWLGSCIASLVAHADGTNLEIVVVENGGSTASRSGACEAFLDVAWVEVPNHGLAHAINCGVEQTQAPYVLLLNPDIEVVDGSLRELLSILERTDDVGLVGVRQVAPDGSLLPTMRRFPSAVRWLGEAVGSESWPVHPDWSGERVLDTSRYDEASDCDWTVGSFLLVRRAALAEVGGLYEGYFLYCEEPDLCLRLAQAGWRTEHRPELTIVHHGGHESDDPRHAAQFAYARRLYMQRHFSLLGRLTGTFALALGYGARLVVGGRDATTRSAARARARAALTTALGFRPPPFPVSSSGPGRIDSP